MEYHVHGKPVAIDGECGLYKSVYSGLSMAYAVLDVPSFIGAVNSLPQHEAIAAVRTWRNTAAQQVEWTQTPGVLGAPLVQMVHAPEVTPIDVAKPGIENTRNACDIILAALQGK